MLSLNMPPLIISNNRGKNGGNLALSITDLGTPLNEIIIKISNSYIERGRAKKGGGLRFWSRTEQKNASICTSDTNIPKLFLMFKTLYFAQTMHLQWVILA